VAYEAPFRCRTVASGSGPRSDRYHNLRAQP
ncbi:SCO6317, partial [Streptomyces coelicolor A3(2)]